MTKSAHFGRRGQLDCSGCSGHVRVTAAGRKTPFTEAAAPLMGGYLSSVFKHDAPKHYRC